MMPEIQCPPRRGRTDANRRRAAFAAGTRICYHRRMTEWLFLFALMGIAWFWLDSHRVLDLARAAARQFCAAQGLQLLDDTVASTRLRFERDDLGRLVLARTYRFEFSDTGDNRLAGSVVMLGRRVGPMHLQAFNIGGEG